MADDGGVPVGRSAVVRVRVAAFSELGARTSYLLWQLRESVFVVEQQCPYPELDGRDLEADTRHLWVDDDGVPVAYLRLLREPDGARIGRVLVAQSHRGEGLAGLLMDAAMEVALAVVGDGVVRLDAQSYLVDWYARRGFDASGPEFLDDGIPHVPMHRQLGDIDGQSVRSRP